jgi:hypothetical protein
MDDVAEYILLRRPQAEKTAIAQTVIYKQDISKRVIAGYQTTLNDQYVMVEDAQTGTLQDAYPGSARPLGTRTLIIDSVSGKTIKTVNGVSLHLQ